MPRHRQRQGHIESLFSNLSNLFAILLVPPEYQKYPSAAQFETLLRSSPHLGQYVRYLQVLDGHAEDFDLGNDEWDDWLPNDTSLSFCLPHLVQLRGLVISHRQDIPFWSLQMRMMVESGLVAALIDILRLPSLRLFEIECFPIGFIQLCQSIDYLALSKPDWALIEDFELPVRYVMEDPIQWDELWFLKFLDVRIECEYHQVHAGGVGSLMWLIRALKEMSSASSGSRLEGLVVQVNYESDDECIDDDLHPWKTLITMLRTRVYFPYLKRAELRIADAGERSDENNMPDIVPRVADMIKFLDANEHSTVIFDVFAAWSEYFRFNDSLDSITEAVQILR
ncbi:hypothetical protein CPB84DRAFT_1769522 [Gymnopilus junonius]|uniref:Uncharacterized protein n=1 Tax=Gymnopilus junonius TaxID=109634 RepID=A0A9P5NVG2_GYMJU|nr:hypothetical protein CPB84DRAFT_1769522 [Gymnopilus junonius]